VGGVIAEDRVGVGAGHGDAFGLAWYGVKLRLGSREGKSGRRLL